jgi:8-amino-7-oxononanoate synthase
MPRLEQVARDTLDALESQRLRRVPEPTTRERGAVVRRRGRRLISFSCNDYLGLTAHR